MLSVGVTAMRDSVTPAPKPAMTVRGPETLPSASASRVLYWSKATKRMPALAELPMMSVVQPAYHCAPNGGHGSFLPAASRRFSCVRVLATVSWASQRGPRWPASPLSEGVGQTGGAYGRDVHSAGYVMAGGR